MPTTHIVMDYPRHGGTLRPGVAAQWHGGFAWGGYRGGFGQVVSSAPVVTGRAGPYIGWGAISAATKATWEAQARLAAGTEPKFPEESKEWLTWDAKRLEALAFVKTAEAGAVAATGKTVGGEAVTTQEGILLATEAAMHVSRARDQRSAARRAKTVAQLTAEAAAAAAHLPPPGAAPSGGIPEGIGTIALLGGGALLLAKLAGVL